MFFGVWRRSCSASCPCPCPKLSLRSLACSVAFFLFFLHRPRLPVASAVYPNRLRSVVSLALVYFFSCAFSLLLLLLFFCSLLVLSRFNGARFSFLLSFFLCPCPVLALVAPPFFPRAVPPDPLSRLRCVKNFNRASLLEPRAGGSSRSVINC